MAVPNGPTQAPLRRTGAAAKPTTPGSEDATHPSSTATGSTYYAATASDSGGGSGSGGGTLAAGGSTRRRRPGRSGGTRGDKTSSYRGVTATDRGKAWRARIRFGSAILNIGRFDAEVVAAAAYDVAAHLLFGPGAVLNFPLSGGHHAAASARDMSRLLQRALGPATPPAVLRALNGGGGGEDEAPASTHSAQERARKSPRAASPPEAPAAEPALPAPLVAQAQPARPPAAAAAGGEGEGGVPLHPPPRQESTNAAAAAAAVAHAAAAAAAPAAAAPGHEGVAVGPRPSGGVGVRFSGGFPPLPTLGSDLDSLLGGLGSLSELASLDDRLAAEALGGAVGSWADVVPVSNAAAAACAAPPPVPAALAPPGARAAAMGAAQAPSAVASPGQQLWAAGPQSERRHAAPAALNAAPAAPRPPPVTTNACHHPPLPAIGQGHVCALAPGGLPQQAAGPSQAPGMGHLPGGGGSGAWPPPAPAGYGPCEASAVCEVVRLATARPDLVLFGLRAAADAAARGVISPLEPEDTARLAAAAESLRSLAATRLWVAFGL